MLGLWAKKRGGLKEVETRVRDDRAVACLPPSILPSPQQGQQGPAPGLRPILLCFRVSTVWTAQGRVPACAGKRSLNMRLYREAFSPRAELGSTLQFRDWTADGAAVAPPRPPRAAQRRTQRAGKRRPGAKWVRGLLVDHGYHSDHYQRGSIAFGGNRSSYQ